MNLRERVLKVLSRQKADFVPWLGDLDYWKTYLNKSGKMPEEYKGNGFYKLHRDLGVGFYLQGYYPFKTVYDGGKITTVKEGNSIINTVETPYGNLREVNIYLPDSYTWATREHYIKDIEDFKALRYWYENTYYEPNYKLAEERYELIGDNGLVLCYLPKSPFMELVTLLAGIEATTYAIADDEDEFTQTLKLMEKKTDEAANIALLSPAECLMIPENLSSEVVGKSYFHNYMESFEVKWNHRIKEKGKYSFVHMDGTMKGLIKEVSSTGFAVMEALTPSPVGDLSIEDLHNWVPDSTIIWGGIPGVYFTDLVSDKDFDEFVIGVINIMKKEPRYVLGVADQVPPGSRFERIARVNELVMKYGEY